MNMERVDLGGVSRIALEGRLDNPGVDQIGTRFTAGTVAPGKNAIVDFSAVTFVSSMGIRLLLTCAQALALKNGRLVIFGLQPLVKQSLDYVQVGQVIPMADDEVQALEILKPA
jgi:anti-sigma B factor antagonist